MPKNNIFVADAPRRPVSLESEKQKALLSIMCVERELREFKETNFKDPSDEEINAWLLFTETAHQSIKAKRIARNLKDFEVVLNKYVSHKIKEADNPVHHQLREIIERGKQFDKFILSCGGKVKNALENHVGKYCLSFSAETEGIDLPPVFEYENTTTKWRQYSYEAEKQLESSYQCLSSVFGNVNEYLQNYPQAVHFMTLCIDALPKMYSPIKFWVTADKVYGRKLKGLIKIVEREKEVIDEEVRQCGFQIEDIKRGIQRQNRDVERYRRILKDTIGQKHECRRNEYASLDKSDELAEILEERKRDLKSTLLKVQYCRTSRPGEYDQTVSKANRLEEEISELEYFMNNVRNSLKDFKKDKCNIQKDVHNKRVTYEKNVKIQENQRHSAGRLDGHLADLQHKQRELTKKLNALRKICSLKFSRDTVKRIYTEDYIPGIKDTQGTVEQRTRYLDTLYEELAIENLDKWSRLSQNASTKALTRTLKSIKVNNFGNKAIPVVY